MVVPNTFEAEKWAVKSEEDLKTKIMAQARLK